MTTSIRKWIISITMISAVMFIGFMVYGKLALASVDRTDSVKSAEPKVQNIVRYYSTTGNLGDQNPANYIYVDGTSNDCTFVEEVLCSAEFDIGENTPSPGFPPPMDADYIGNEAEGTSPYQN